MEQIDVAVGCSVLLAHDDHAVGKSVLIPAEQHEVGGPAHEVLVVHDRGHGAG